MKCFLFYRRFSKSDNEPGKKIFSFLAIYMLYIWGNVSNYDMVLRSTYVFGILSPVLVTFLTDKSIWLNNELDGIIEKIVSMGAIFLCLVLCKYVNYKLHVNWF